LVEHAHQLGGSDLVNKWIDLHVVGEKKDQIIKIAKEENLI
jgi:transketolase